MKTTNQSEKVVQARVLVTGAGGFVGSNLCRHLLEEGYEVFGLTRGSQEKVEFLKSNKKFKAIKGDLLNHEEILEIIKKIRPEGVFHVAALHSPKPIDSPFPFFEANVQGTANLLEACRQAGVDKFVHSSSMSVYGLERKYLPVDEKHPTAPYDFYSLTKLMGEDLCRFYAQNFDINIIILRYVGIYGPRRDWGALTNFVESALQNKTLNILNNISWDIISARDAAQANIQAFKKANELGSEIINIGSGREINIKDLASKIIEACNSQSKIELAPDLPASPSAHFYFDINKARELLGFEPGSFDEGLLEYIREMKKL